MAIADDLHSKANDTQVTLIPTGMEHILEARTSSVLHQIYDPRIDDEPPLRRDDYTFSVARTNPADNTWQLWWDWQFGARMLARFGTCTALEVSRRSILVSKVQQWKAQVQQAKARAQQRAAADILSG